MFLKILIIIIGLIFIYKLFDLQIINGESYRAQSEKRLIRTVDTYAPRGNIYDRNGKLLVTSEIKYKLAIFKTKANSSELNEYLLKIANILIKNGDEYNNSFPIDLNNLRYLKSDKYISDWKKENKIDDNLEANEIIDFFINKYELEEYDMEDAKKIIALRYEIAQNGYSSYKSCIIAENVSEKSMLELSEQAFELSGIYFYKNPTRKYLYGNTLSHVLGYVGKISKEEYEERKEDGYTINDVIGKLGVERSFEEYLRGVQGKKHLEMDSNGLITSEEETIESKMGDDIYLTIDIDFQQRVEQELKKIIDEIQAGKYNGLSYKDATCGSAITLDVKTGEVLAIASYPSYNPEDFVDGLSNQEYQDYFESKDKPMYNRAIQGVYPPGSIFKMVTGIAGLENNAIGVNDYVTDKGIFNMGHKPACWLWNSRRQTHGNVNAMSALKVSCNYYYYEVASRVGIDKIADYAKKFGLGEKTGIELPAESTGTVSSREYAEKIGKAWTIGDTLSSSIGQSYNMYTPLQMCHYISTIANGGKNKKVTILKDAKDSLGNQLDIKEIKKHIDEKNGIKENSGDVEISTETLNAIFEGMRSVTGDRGGTVYGTFNDFPIEVARKNWHSYIR
ncbi:MAG: hypothetical protein IKR04_01290 [Clostridia bacterium]|nr:hypothetical protein [Clostridia bacterium]